MSKKNNKDDQEKGKDDLQNFDIKINEFGEIITSYSIDKLNDFLDKNVEDKKLKNRQDDQDTE